MVAEQIPADLTGLSAGQACHAGIHIPLHDDAGAVPFLIAPVHAVGCVRFHDDDLRRVVRIEGGEVAGHSASHAADARLNEHVGRARAELLRGFVRHHPVALHDPGWNVEISGPGGILNNDAVGCLLRKPGSLPHTFIIVQVLNCNLCPKCADVVEAGLCGSLRHQDHAALVEHSGCPGDAAPVVAVRSREEGAGGQCFQKMLVRQDLVGKLRYISADFACQKSAHRISTAECLEGVQTIAEGLILYHNRSEPEIRGHLLQASERCLLILREGSVKIPGFGDLLF